MVPGKKSSIKLLSPSAVGWSSVYRTIRPGGPVIIFTIGYEQRKGAELISMLRGAGVGLLADIREKPMSRLSDFRGKALRGFCETAGIEYRHWSELGSTEKLRDHLKDTGDFKRFEAGVRRHILRQGKPALAELAAAARHKPTALLCYERLHEECHRSTVAEMLADMLDAGLVAL